MPPPQSKEQKRLIQKEKEAKAAAQAKAAALAKGESESVKKPIQSGKKDDKVKVGKTKN